MLGIYLHILSWLWFPYRIDWFPMFFSASLDWGQLGLLVLCLSTSQDAVFKCAEANWTEPWLMFFFPNGLSHCRVCLSCVDITSWWWFRASQRICISETLNDAESAHAQAMWEVIERPRSPKGTYKIWTWSHASLRRPKRCKWFRWLPKNPASTGETYCNYRDVCAYCSDWWRHSSQSRGYACPQNCWKQKTDERNFCKRGGPTAPPVSVKDRKHSGQRRVEKTRGFVSLQLQNHTMWYHLLF